MLQNHEGLGLNPHTDIKKPGVALCRSVTTVPWEWRQEARWGLLVVASQSPGPVETLFQRNEMGNDRARYPTSSL
ncbi:hypothetical protein I79_005533 [Cricetulus griseus]|uniref:Uncharacterized protein n=1 Tax=Cricetulus griseus TaxID=10029 RepID=G3H5E6_CRIGR|nr:hypothetical protein I79_005533 [Cricetulus griseus]